MKVFVSYSRKDRDFVARVVDALEAEDGIEVFRDTDDILPTEEWQGRLEQLIREADTIVFALSPHSATSEVCRWEVDLAESLNKRFAPIVIRDVEGQDIPPALAKLNYIFFTTDAEFERSIGNLVAALNTDIGWIREHTRLASLARRWDLRGRPAINTLRGGDLKAAEEWIATHPRNAPQPTELHHAFVQASRTAATHRQRMTVGGSLAAAVVAIALAGYALVQQRVATAERDRAVIAEGLAETRAVAERKARDEAEAALRTATDAANRLVFGLAQKFENSSVPGRIIQSILDEARKLQDELAANFPDDLELLHTKAAALMQLGDVYAHMDDLSKAAAAYEESLRIRRDLLTRDTEGMPGQQEQWLGDVSASLNRIGNIRLSEGNTSGALEAYEESLGISRELVEREPEFAKWQRELSISLNKVGGVRLKLGDATGALEAYEEGLGIRRKRARSAPGNAQAQRDLAISLNAIGDLRLRAADMIGAQEAYEENLKIVRDLVAGDPDNTEWQRDLLFSLNNIGDVRRRTGDVPGALEAYEESLNVRRKLVKRDPDNTQWQRDLSVGLDRIGGIRRSAGDLDGALAAYEEGLRIRQDLVRRDPGNAEWQRVLSFSLSHIGGTHRRAGETSRALAAYGKSLEIRRGLVKRDPANTDWQRDVSVTLNDIGDSRRDARDVSGALEAYRESLDIAHELASRDRGNVRWQTDEIVSLFKIAITTPDVGEKRKALKEAIRLIEPLEENGLLTASQKNWPKLFRKRFDELPADTAAQ